PSTATAGSASAATGSSSATGSGEPSSASSPSGGAWSTSCCSNGYWIGCARPAHSPPAVRGPGMVSSARMTLLIDYSSLLYRAFHSLPETIPMRGVYGFLGMLARLLLDRRPEQLALAVDDDWRPAFRVTALPTYKTHRLSDEPDPVEADEAPGRRLLGGPG